MSNSMSNSMWDTMLQRPAVRTSGRVRVIYESISNELINDFPEFCDAFISNLTSVVSSACEGEEHLSVLAELHIVEELITLYKEILSCSRDFSKGADLTAIFDSEATFKEIELSPDFVAFRDYHKANVQNLLDRRKALRKAFHPVAGLRFIPSASREAWIAALDSERFVDWTAFKTFLGANVDSFSPIVNGLGQGQNFNSITSNKPGAVFRSIVDRLRGAAERLREYSSISLVELSKAADYISPELYGNDGRVTWFDNDHVLQSESFLILPILEKRASKVLELEAADPACYWHAGSEGWVNMARAKQIDPNAIARREPICLADVITHFIMCCFTARSGRSSAPDVIGGISVPLGGHCMYPLFNLAVGGQIPRYLPDYKFRSLEYVLSLFKTPNKTDLMTNIRTVIKRLDNQDLADYARTVRAAWLKGIEPSFDAAVARVIDKRGVNSRAMICVAPNNTARISTLYEQILEGSVSIAVTEPMELVSDIVQSYPLSSSEGILIVERMDETRVIESFPCSDANSYISDTYRRINPTDHDFTIEVDAQVLLQRGALLAHDRDASVNSVFPGTVTSLSVSDVVGRIGYPVQITHDVTLCEVIPSPSPTIRFSSLTRPVGYAFDSIECRRSSMGWGWMRGDMLYNPTADAFNHLVLNLFRATIGSLQDLWKFPSVVEEIKYAPQYRNDKYYERLADRDLTYTERSFDVHRLRAFSLNKFATVLLGDVKIDPILLYRVEKDRILVHNQMYHEMRTMLINRLTLALQEGLITLNGLREVNRFMTGVANQSDIQRMRSGLSAPLYSAYYSLVLGEERQFSILFMLHVGTFFELMTAIENCSTALQAINILEAL